MRLQSQLLSEKRFDEHLDPIPFSGSNNSSQRIRWIGDSGHAPPPPTCWIYSPSTPIALLGYEPVIIYSLTGRPRGTISWKVTNRMKKLLPLLLTCVSVLTTLTVLAPRAMANQDCNGNCWDALVSCLGHAPSHRAVLLLLQFGVRTSAMKDRGIHLIRRDSAK